MTQRTDLVCPGQTVDLHLGARGSIAEVVERSAGVRLKVVTQIRSPDGEHNTVSQRVLEGLLNRAVTPQRSVDSLVEAVRTQVDSVEVRRPHLKPSTNLVLLH